MALIKFQKIDGTPIGINPELVEAVSHPSEADQNMGAKSNVHLVSGKVFGMKNPFEEAIKLINVDTN
jgi:hypothetical protein